MVYNMQGVFILQDLLLPLLLKPALEVREINRI